MRASIPATGARAQGSNNLRGRTRQPSGVTQEAAVWGRQAQSVLLFLSWLWLVDGGGAARRAHSARLRLQWPWSAAATRRESSRARSGDV